MPLAKFLFHLCGEADGLLDWVSRSITGSYRVGSGLTELEFLCRLVSSPHVSYLEVQRLSNPLFKCLYWLSVFQLSSIFSWVLSISIPALRELTLLLILEFLSCIRTSFISGSISSSLCTRLLRTCLYSFIKVLKAPFLVVAHIWAGLKSSKDCSKSTNFVAFIEESSSVCSEKSDAILVELLLLELYADVAIPMKSKLSSLFICCLLVVVLNSSSPVWSILIL